MKVVDPKTDDKKDVKNAFVEMMGKSKTRWRESSPYCPRHRKLKRIQDNASKSQEMPSNILDWIRRVGKKIFMYCNVNF